jgi:hypothetical protein
MRCLRSFMPSECFSSTFQVAGPARSRNLASSASVELRIAAIWLGWILYRSAVFSPPRMRSTYTIRTVRHISGATVSDIFVHRTSCFGAARQPPQTTGHRTNVFSAQARAKRPVVMTCSFSNLIDFFTSRASTALIRSWRSLATSRDPTTSRHSAKF